MWACAQLGQTRVGPGVLSPGTGPGTSGSWSCCTQRPPDGNRVPLLCRPPASSAIYSSLFPGDSGVGLGQQGVTLFLRGQESLPVGAALPLDRLREQTLG